MNFIERLHTMINGNKKMTENRAAGYATTGRALVDLNFAVASLRSMTEAQIIKKFVPAFYEDRMLAMKWLFFLRDARGGLGERRTFRIIIRYLAGNASEMISGLIDIMAEYGRYDDLLCLFNTALENEVLTVLRTQLEEDITNMSGSGKISLCAKRMPGNNTSSQESRRDAAKLQHFMGMTAKEYRQMLSSLRAYLDVTEVYMSADRWNEIDYTKVSSKANIIYRNAFMLHDQARRKDYLKEVQENRAVIHAGALMPHEIVAQYMVRTGWRMKTGAEDVTLEEFDMAVNSYNTETLFDTIKRRFAVYGYKMPKLVFWNVNSRTNVIPVRENELGVALVSGFSVNICNMVLSNELDPFACLKKVLDSERYRKVEERLCS